MSTLQKILDKTKQLESIISIKKNKDWLNGLTVIVKSGKHTVNMDITLYSSMEEEFLEHLKNIIEKEIKFLTEALLKEKQEIDKFFTGK